MLPPDEPEVPQTPTETPPADDLRGDIEKAFAADQDAQSPVDQQAREPAQGPPVPGERARDAYGRFTRQQEREAGQALDTSQPQRPQEAVAAPRAGPPPGWSVASKAIYDKLPDAVKADIAKREMEVSQGFAKLAEYKGLDPFVELARNSGTTLPEALSRYINAENALEADSINGLLWLCQRYNVHPAQLLQAIGGDQGDQQPDPSVPQLDPRLASHFQAFDQRLGIMEQEREAAEDQAISSQIISFAHDPANRYYENVRHDMAHIIRTAPQNQPLTLKDVYEQACWAHPEIREQLINERAYGRQRNTSQRAAEIRRNGGSLPSGSPVVGGTMTRNEPAATLREEIERAFDEHRV